MSPDLPAAHHYYQWIVDTFNPYLRGRILDIGGGWGAHLAFILPQHGDLVSIDCDAASVEAMRARYGRYPQFQAWHLDFGEVRARTTLMAQRFETIMALNVLEHIEDDVGALKIMCGLLQAQRGVVLLQVPAHAWLYGTLDRQAGHYRRYSRATLRRALVAAGFECVRLRYFNAFGVLPWLINARLLKASLASKEVAWQIRFFDRWLVPVLRAVETCVRVPFGQSLIAMARAAKPSDG